MPDMKKFKKLPILDVRLDEGVNTLEKLIEILPKDAWKATKPVTKRYGRKERQVVQVSPVVGGTMERRIRKLTDNQKESAIKEEVRKLCDILADEDMEYELASEQDASNQKEEEARLKIRTGLDKGKKSYGIPD